MGGSIDDPPGMIPSLHKPTKVGNRVLASVRAEHVTRDPPTGHCF